ncbi:MAG TPA: hypothetical protein HPQ00_10985, partial [Magnetococcales bacterium]|nr:hypothetical protein [Magnetococcales bacterium]
VAGVCDPYDVDNLIEAARPQAGSNLGDFQKSGSANVTWTPGTYFYNSFTLSGSGDVLLSTSGNDARSERDDRRCHAGHHARHRHHHDNDGNDNEGRHGDRDRDHDRDRDRDDDHGDSDNVGNGDQHADFYLFVDGPFRMSGSAKLVLGAGAHLTIYHTGGRDHDQDFTIHGSSDLVATASPGQTEIYSNTTGVLSVAGSGDLAAAIYAPKAAVRVAGSGDLYGASHSKTFEVTGSGGIKYDRYLGEAVSDVAGGINVTVSGWAEEFVVR